MFVRRSEHDALIAQYPAWMREHWPLFERSWGIGGVMVSGPEALMMPLRVLLGLVAAPVAPDGPVTQADRDLLAELGVDV